jgi:hypothetical protein
MSVNISLDFVEIDGDNDNLSFIILKKFPAISGLISNSQRSIRHYALAFKTTSLCSTPHHTPSIYYNLTPLFSIKTQFNLDTIYKKHNLNQLIFKKNIRIYQPQRVAKVCNTTPGRSAPRLA